MPLNEGELDEAHYHARICRSVQCLDPREGGSNTKREERNTRTLPGWWDHLDDYSDSEMDRPFVERNSWR